MNAQEQVAERALDIGFITVRVVALDKRATADSADQAPEDTAPDEVLPEEGRTPLASYLEDPKRGRLCCVFLVNGQRQHGWDNTFIVKDLGLKYLRNRIMVIAEVDGLKPEALSELMQGSRNSFYEGRVFDAISSRLVGVLKGDEDLQKLEAEAEDEIASLRSGDEAVKGALDHLIEAHTDIAARAVAGSGEAGNESAQPGGATRNAATSAVVLSNDHVGAPASEPTIMLTADAATLRFEPGKTRRLIVGCQPSSAWDSLESFIAHIDDAGQDFHISTGKLSRGGYVDITYHEPPGMSTDDYPIEGILKIEARFKDHNDPRLIVRPIKVAPAINRPPPTPPILLVEPSWLKVGGRQPLRLQQHGPDLHVRCRWNGKDELAQAPGATWTFSAKSIDREDWPSFAFSEPRMGRFELLLHAPAGTEVGQRFRFSITATGPAGRSLATDFECEVVEPPSPRKIATISPSGQHRRPPYELKYVEKADWKSVQCWDAVEWMANDVGCFHEPTTSKPLVLILNQDYQPLVDYREMLIQRKLAEATIQERATRYSAHVAYHLYQMYLSTVVKNKQNADNVAPLPSTLTYRAEVQRVASTLLKLMEFTR
jgi:hypothetical protein